MSSCARESHTPVLQMHTFGTFSLSWDGKRIDILSRTGSVQDVVILQLLLHRRKEGVPREQLLDALFLNRELKDVSHSLQVSIYNLKAKLRAAGLPPVNYIENRQSIFFWTEEIPVEEDAEVFESLCREASLQEVGEEKLRMLLKACELYTGEFLYLQSDQLWVNREARRYETMFNSCVIETAKLLQKKKDWKQLMLLGRQAAQAQPYFGWERLIMEALIASGRYTEAINVYRHAERRYGSEMNLAPDARMTLLYEQASVRNVLPVRELDRIRNDLANAEHSAGGGFLCPYPIFERVFRVARKLSPLSGARVCLMGVVLDKDRRQAEPTEMSRTVEQLCEVIRRAISEEDAMTRYGDRQFLVLLMDGSLENRQRIVAKINGAQLPSGGPVRVKYHFIEVSGPAL